MKEDVLEQLIEDYLQTRGYFTRHNVPFKPARVKGSPHNPDHAVHSDVDVVGINPLKRGREKVRVVSCKSWQQGFNAAYRLDQMQGKAPNPKRSIWRSHRELWDPAWAKSFRDEVEALTDRSTFHYTIAVTRLTGKVKDPEEAADLWVSNPTIKANLAGSTFSFLEFRDVWQGIQDAQVNTTSSRPASSEIGRLAQLLRAARID